MRIVNRKEFSELPNGTLFSEYNPVVFQGLFIKCEQMGSDYGELSLIGNVKAASSDQSFQILESAEENGTSFDLDFESYGRNGIFNEEQKYAIYERKDIEELIQALKETLL